MQSTDFDRRGSLRLALVLSLFWAWLSCAPPATVHRPVIRPDDSSPRLAEQEPAPGGAGELLQHQQELQGLVREAREAIRIRVFARPVEGDDTTDALVQLSRAVLGMAKVPTRFDLDDPLANAAVAGEAQRLGVLPLGMSPAGEPPAALPPDAHYRALVLAIGSELVVLPQVEPGRGDLEFQLAEAISRLLHGPRRLGLVAPPDMQHKLTKFAQLLHHLEIRPVDLRQPLPEELSAVVVVAEHRPVQRTALDNLRNFLQAGRAAAFLLDGVEVQPQRRRYAVRPARHGWGPLLEEFGVTVERNLVFDHRCARVSVPARVGRMLLPYPPIPQVDVVNRQMIAEATQVRLPFASSLELQTDRGWQVTPLLRSSSSSWAVASRFDLSPYQEWQPSARRGPLVVGASLERSGGRLAVIGSARFIEDAYLVADDNASFTRQLIEWLGGHRNLARMLLARDQALPVGSPAGPVAQGRP